MKKIAVVTGASSGIGKEFALTLNCAEVAFDEVWVIARGREKLEALELPWPKRVIALDLSDRASFDAYAKLLEEVNAEVTLLVNASGFGRFAATENISLADSLNMVDLNSQAVMAMCHLTLPYMKSGAKIVNIASVAAFQPIPYINVYAASKAFVLSFSRGLNREVRKRGISVLAVCPFWTKTAFFDRAIAKDRDAIVKKYTAMYYPEQIVKRAWRDLKRGRDVSKFGFVARAQALGCKLLPHTLIMDIWQKQQSL